ncbi:murein L,D-transpeptidase catalytic domain family protein [Novosphingobium sp. KCTC 2891]|uniref:murein L,D-transpeptidase catalytic domain family protein n=1 Tax=Novosphingobium sp. KCTC 2891 TaxID=2989730 RepID=UPI002222E1D2|nr:murein L,D-transpeptidase catalytic domain family protein [Novosphingobium sp. KCTC 2891]MCW1381371.1 murein L,D-transpeptidase catalytic domain family protein [Novosphingobium sp. KCTC 2891]
MTLGRRQFLGAVAASATTFLFPRSAANAIAPATHGAGLALPPVTPPGLTAPAGLSIPGAPALLPQALAALQTHHARIAERDVIGIVDFSVPSREPRFHLVDIAGGRVLSTHLVAHGKGSDPANKGWVERLSNTPGSEASCSGAFMTGPTYVGKHGRSRRLIGLDPENNLADSRGIVIHAASYVDHGMASNLGRIGRSQGCFAVSQDEISGVLQALGPGRLLFAAR